VDERGFYEYESMVRDDSHFGSKFQISRITGDDLRKRAYKQALGFSQSSGSSRVADTNELRMLKINKTRSEKATDGKSNFFRRH
jgi:hypothetical protein